METSFHLIKSYRKTWETYIKNKQNVRKSLEGIDYPRGISEVLGELVH